MRPRPCFWATLVTNTNCVPQPDPRPQVRPLRGWMMSQHIRLAMPLGPKFYPVRVLPSLFPRAHLWNSSFGGTPEVTNLKGVLPFHRLTKNNCDRTKSPERKIRPWPMRLPRHSTAISDTKSRDKSLSKCLRLALSLYPEEFFSWFIDRACHTYLPKAKLSLCFQTSVPKVLGHTPSRLGPQVSHIRTVSTQSMGILPIPLSKTVKLGEPSKSLRPSQ